MDNVPLYESTPNHLTEDEIMKCGNCDRTISGPKIVVNKTGQPGTERFWCSECVYRLEKEKEKNK